MASDTTKDVASASPQSLPPTPARSVNVHMREADRKSLQSLKFLEPEQPTRFDASNVPPYLYLIVEREEWKKNSEQYKPRNRTDAQGVPLCDIDRLDSLAARKYFLHEYKQTMLRRSQSTFFDDAAEVLQSGIERIGSLLSWLPLGMAKLLHSSSSNVASTDNSTPAKTRAAQDERPSKDWTDVQNRSERVVRRAAYLLVILKTDGLDLAWDGGHSAGSNWPRLTRSLRHATDVWAEFPLAFDTEKSIVCLPNTTDLTSAFNKASKVVERMHAK